MATATQACPYCAEQIPSVAIKCTHCGSALDAGPSPEPLAVSNLLRLRVGPALLVPALLVVLVLLVGAVLGTWIQQTRTISASGFTDEDVTNIENDIRAHFTDRGTKVTDVQLIRESPTRLAGFAKMRMLGIPVTKSCTVTIGRDRQSIWRCR